MGKIEKVRDIKIKLSVSLIPAGIIDLALPHTP